MLRPTMDLEHWWVVVIVTFHSRDDLSFLGFHKDFFFMIHFNDIFQCEEMLQCFVVFYCCGLLSYF